MVTIKGFHMKNGKITEETVKKMEKEGVKLPFQNMNKKEKGKIESIGSIEDMKKFEKETGKNAEWNGKLTKQYKKWLKKRKK